jgi:hypothetical protein
MNSTELIARFTKHHQDNAALFAQKIKAVSYEMKQADENLTCLTNKIESQFETETRVTDLLLNQNLLLDFARDEINDQKQSVYPKRNRKRRKKKVKNEDHQEKSVVRSPPSSYILPIGSTLEVLVTDNFPVYTGRNLSLGTFVQYLNRKGKWLDANVVYNDDDDGSVTLLNLFGYKFTTKIENVRLCFGSTVEHKESGCWLVVYKVKDLNTYSVFLSDATHCAPIGPRALHTITTDSVQLISNIMAAIPDNFHSSVRTSESYLKFCEFYDNELFLHLEYLYACFQSGLVVPSEPLDLVSIFKQVEILLLKDQMEFPTHPNVPKSPITQFKINSMLRDN